ncbi:hypothetical protein HN803_00755 [candidate division WWE3 bacterium]|jgi:hypothetical protein|nr:hypothetical protein [candidate division WWE3 bacterium]MBT7349311.1 hypothetical protein [candidate division WWE3 bacterium]
MKMNIAQRLLSNKLHELLVQELDFEDSQVNILIDNISLNVILKSLTKEKRIEFYRHISTDDYEKAKTLIKNEIPDFDKKVLIGVKKEFKKIL